MNPSNPFAAAFTAPGDEPEPLALSGVRLYPKVRAWSYSVVQQHKKCPLSIRFQKIDRLPQPDNEFQGRGKSIHDELAHLVRTGEFPEGAVIPYREQWKTRLGYLYEVGAQAELQHAFTRDWKTVSWFGANVWGRVVIDALLISPDGIAAVHEHKTGKYYPEHEIQERLYALVVFKARPDVQTVLVQCNYIDIPDRATTITSFDRSQEAALEKEFTEFAAPLLSDDIYPARSGPHCNWCHYRHSNQGPCSFG